MADKGTVDEALLSVFEDFYQKKITLREAERRIGLAVNGDQYIAASIFRAVDSVVRLSNDEFEFAKGLRETYHQEPS